jgi:glycosyltransferase involved in cell wall biosynthesis
VRILLVSPMAPRSHSYGASMRVGAVAQTLAELGTVDLVLLTGEPGEGALAAEFDRSAALLPHSGRRTARSIRSMFGPSVPAQLAARRRRLAAVQPEWLTRTRYDLAWYNRERSFLVARPFVHARRSIVDMDDLEDVVLRRWLDLGLGPDGHRSTGWRRRQMRADVRWWQAVHRRVARQTDVRAFASEIDRGRGGAARSVVLPNTYPVPAEAGHMPSPVPTIVFPGLLTYPPNEDAAQWTVEQIMPRVWQRLPGARLVLVGEASARVRALARHPAVEVTGRVESTAPYLRAADLVLVPLRVGGGTRIKILEAFAYAVPVVATSVGAEGLDVVDGVHLEIADDAEVLSARCLRLLADAPARARIAAAASELHLRRYLPEQARIAVRQSIELASLPAD